MAPRSVQLTPENLAVLSVAGRPLYIVKAPDAALWDYHRLVAVVELPDVAFKRYLLMYGNRGHKEALELEVVKGTPPARALLLGKTLSQV